MDEISPSAIAWSNRVARKLLTHANGYLVKFKDGRTGIKVLPRIVQRISNYYNKVGAASHVESVDLYFSLDPYFDLYPNSSALKVHIIDPDVLEEHLKNAHKMYCEGEKVGLV